MVKQLIIAQVCCLSNEPSLKRAKPSVQQMSDLPEDRVSQLNMRHLLLLVVISFDGPFMISQSTVSSIST